MKDTITYSGIKSVIIGLAFSMILSVVLIFIFAWILFSSSMPESASGAIIFAVSLVSAFAGGLVCARMTKNRGLIFGALIGFLYFAVLYVISCFLGMRPDFAPASVSMIIFGIGSGALGGVIGVNTVKKK